ncbi:hypothetical protein HK096_009504, partial [Nowakowskiella sp. JEL0078]
MLSHANIKGSAEELASVLNSLFVCKFVFAHANVSQCPNIQTIKFRELKFWFFPSNISHPLRYIYGDCDLIFATSFRFEETEIPNVIPLIELGVRNFHNPSFLNAVKIGNIVRESSIGVWQYPESDWEPIPIDEARLILSWYTVYKSQSQLPPLFVFATKEMKQVGSDIANIKQLYMGIDAKKEMIFDVQTEECIFRLPSVIIGDTPREVMPSNQMEPNFEEISDMFRMISNTSDNVIIF